MVHGPAIPPERERVGDMLSVIGSITSLLQLIPLLLIIRRFRAQGATTGDYLFPHVVDWISAAITLYIDLVSRFTTPEEKFGVAAASAALLVHTLFIMVYLSYGGRSDRICAASCLAGTIIAICLSYRYWAGMQRVYYMQIIGAGLSGIAMVLAVISTIRDWHAGNVENTTVLDAVLAVAYSVIVAIGGHFRGTVMLPEIVRIAVGVVQTVLFWYIRAHPRAPPPLLPLATSQPPPQPLPSLPSPSPSPSPLPSHPPSPSPQQPSASPPPSVSISPSLPQMLPPPFPSLMPLPPQLALPQRRGHLFYVVCIVLLVYVLRGPVFAIACIIALLFRGRV